MKTQSDIVRKKLAKIAKSRLGIGSLVARGRDALDFHEVGVEHVGTALLDAYNLGRADMKKARLTAVLTGAE